MTPGDDGDRALRAIVEGVEAETGTEFFRSLVRQLASALEVAYAFVTEFTEDRTGFRTIALWGRGAFLPNLVAPLAGTPCEAVLNGQTAHHPERLQESFPSDRALGDWGVESYCGVPIYDAAGAVAGHLAILDDKPMPDGNRGVSVMRIFAARVRAELERLRVEAEYRASEERYRDLYDEAPIAYIYEDLESRFVRANRAACRLLGVKPDEVVGTLGKSLLAPTPENIQRVEAALEAMRTRGTEFSCVELELRRNDNGEPLWVQWWSKPEPDGKHTRTMLVDITERVLMSREKARLEEQNVYLQEEIKSVHNFEEIIGQSPALQGVLKKVGLVAGTDSSVLISGETGTGKELIARAVHSNSSRRSRPLIKVNCAALPTGLIESELFGHEKGAFTGALERRIGRFELAHGGTIFLDEIGELPPEVQVKLLRVLQEREFDRVGGSATIKTDVRVIAATNRDLAKAAAEGSFRQDLYYRLNVFPVLVPPLRERQEDIPLLVHYFVGRYAAKIGRKITRLSENALSRLVAYPWPGNVRELENVIERAVILSAGPELEIGPEVLPAVAPPSVQPVPLPAGAEVATEAATLEDVERNHILATLKRTNWRIDGPNGAARILKLHPSTLRSRIQKLGIRRSADGLS
jgi:PAS domain S-box-containing protein